MVQLDSVKIMIRGSGDVISSTYSQTLNGSAMFLINIVTSVNDTS